MSLYEELTNEEKEIFKVIKTLRQNYTVNDFLEAIQKIKNQENEEGKEIKKAVAVDSVLSKDKI